MKRISAGWMFGVRGNGILKCNHLILHSKIIRMNKITVVEHYIHICSQFYYTLFLSNCNL